MIKGWGLIVLDHIIIPHNRIELYWARYYENLLKLNFIEIRFCTYVVFSMKILTSTNVWYLDVTNSSVKRSSEEIDRFSSSTNLNIQICFFYIYIFLYAVIIMEARPNCYIYIHQISDIFTFFSGPPCIYRSTLKRKQRGIIPVFSSNWVSDNLRYFGLCTWDLNYHLCDLAVFRCYDRKCYFLWHCDSRYRFIECNGCIRTFAYRQTPKQDSYQHLATVGRYLLNILDAPKCPPASRAHLAPSKMPSENK